MGFVRISALFVSEVYASVCGCFDAALAMVSFMFDFFDIGPLQNMNVPKQFHWLLCSVKHHSGSSRSNSTVLTIGVEFPILYVQYESKEWQKESTGIRSVLKVGKVRERSISKYDRVV